MIVLAVILGVIAGLLGFLPFLLVSRWLRKMFAERGLAMFKFVMSVPLVSFILMFGLIALYVFLVVEYALIFAIVCVMVFLLSTIVLGVMQVRKTKR